MKDSLFSLAAAFLAITCSVPSANASNVFANVPEVTVDDYRVLYELDPPVDGGFWDSKPVPYQTDNSQIVPNFDRVAYYLELTNAQGTRWVYVSMDAFSDDPKKLGLPHNISNPVVHQRTVSNMNVASNVAG